MKKNFDFEMFLEEHGDVFSDYLSHVCTTGYAGGRYEELSERIDRIFNAYPKIAAIVDNDKPKSLTEAECAVLIELLQAKAAIDDIGIKEVYFQGCMDCIGYLKHLNLL